MQQGQNMTEMEEMEWKDLKLKKLRMCNRAQDWQPSLCVAQPGNTASALQQQLPLQAISYLQVKEEEQTVLGTFGTSTYLSRLSCDR